MHLVDLASEALGGAVLWANDEFFAPKENLLHADAPVWREDEYTDRGKWMDGWETRRRREPGHDECIIRLGLPGRIERIVVDTAYFRGNYPEACSVEGCALPADASVEELLAHDGWVKILGRKELEGDSENNFGVIDRRRFTHVRLHIYPDGGVARLRVLGRTIPGPRRLEEGRLDLAAATNGGATIAQSDMFFGRSQNLLKPNRAPNMGDGWETQRRRGPGHDWVVLRLAAEGIIEEVVVDTDHFKGNYPDSCSLELFASAPREPADENAVTPVIEKHKLQAHTRHNIKLPDAPPATHAIVRIYPDGGISRLRFYGKLTDHGHSSVRLQWLNALHDIEAHPIFLSCCGSKQWATQMTSNLPYADVAEVMEQAEESWEAVGRDGWLQAFAAHPKIGEKKAASETTDEAAEWSKGEQSGTASAAEETRQYLADLNERYFERHGFIFITCATGKTAEQMLGELQERVENDTEDEIANAGREQLAITKLRLRKWLGLEH